jgi:mRNA interferase MazF
MYRGEIWLISWGSPPTDESKTGFSAVIVSDDAIDPLPLKVIVPITEWKDQYAVAPWIVRLGPDAENGARPTAADTLQVRSVPKQKCVRQVGKVSDEVMQEISTALALVLSI